MSFAVQMAVEVVTLRQFLPAEQALWGRASSQVAARYHRLTLRSAMEFSQRENCHLGQLKT